MSSNNLEAFTNFLKNVPPTRAVLVDESLTAIAAIMRSELVAMVNAWEKGQAIEITNEAALPASAPQPTDAWIAQVRAAFHAHGPRIEMLAAEIPELSAVVTLIKCTIQAQGVPGPGTDQMITWLERILLYLAQSSAMLKDLGALAKTVNAVMREHEE